MKKTLFTFLLIPLLFCCKTKPEENSIEKKQAFLNIKKQILKDAVLAGGQLIRVDSFPSNYITPRPVDVWLPNNYSEDKEYAVLYMHDGQNLFDATTTWNQQEWKVDEWVTDLTKKNSIKECIVVGIHNIADIRWLDLFPQKAFEYMNPVVKDSIFSLAKNEGFTMDFNGDNYLKFLVEEVKPFIDYTYSTISDKENTFVAGSSMGGLMSMYAICEYPNIFAGAACLSTHWVGGRPDENNPFPDAIFSYMESNLPSPDSHKLYFDYGTETLDQHYPVFAPKVDSIYKTHGYTDINFLNLKFEGTDHSEDSWNQRLDIPLTFLLGK